MRARPVCGWLGGPNVAIIFGLGGLLTAQLHAADSPGGPVLGGECDRPLIRIPASGLSRYS